MLHGVSLLVGWSVGWLVGWLLASLVSRSVSSNGRLISSALNFVTNVILFVSCRGVLFLSLSVRILSCGFYTT